MERRKIDRFTCYAKVIIKDDGNPGYIRDINDTGCQIDLIGACPYSPEQKLKIMILPEESLNIPPFDADIRLKWVEEEEYTSKIGGEITIKEEHKEELKKLVGLFYSVSY